jgi:hypothetical protein
MSFATYLIGLASIKMLTATAIVMILKCISDDTKISNLELHVSCNGCHRIHGGEEGGETNVDPLARRAGEGRVEKPKCEKLGDNKIIASRP